MTRGNFRVDEQALREIIRRYSQVEGEFVGLTEIDVSSIDAGDATEKISELALTMTCGRDSIIWISQQAADITSDFMDEANGKDMNCASRFRALQKRFATW